MNNPYSAPQSNIAPQLREVDFSNVPMGYLQIMCLAMIGGGMNYGGFVLYTSDLSRMELRWSELLNVEYWAYSIQIFFASYVIPWIICKVGVSRLRRSGKLNAEQLFNLYQAQLLAGIFLLVSVVFYGVFWFAESQYKTGWWNVAFLLLAAVFEVAIVARFPTRNRLEKWWKRQLAWEVQPSA